MLGSLRFILALAVAFSHMGLTPNFHFGAMAVVIFYMIAGYVMTHSFRTNFDGVLSKSGSFYIDRFFRIYPLYFVSLILIVVFVMASGYGKLYLDPLSVFINLSVIPLNWYQNIVNPPSWSLGAEVQFYLLLPFLVCFSRLKYLMMLLSYTIFVVASFEVIPPVQWAYKYLPGTLCIFIFGSVIYDTQTDTSNKARYVVLASLVVVVFHLAFLSTFKRHIDQPFAFESLLGIVTGATFIVVLADSKPRHRNIDDWLGRLSYPLFLSHVLVLYFFDHLRIIGAFSPSLRGAVALQIILSIVVSVPLAFLDDRCQKFRKMLQLRNLKDGAM